MMPLTFAQPNTKLQIKNIKGNDKTRNHLRNLGFVDGSDISIVSEYNGNLIVKVKDARIAIDRKLANKIIV